MENLESEIERGQVARRLALESYMGIDFRKRDAVIGVDFVWPFNEQSFTEKEGRQAADAIHEFRFPGEEFQDTPEAREAAENYCVTVYKPETGQTKVRISFSPEDYEKTQKQIMFRNWRKFLNHH